MCTLVIFGFIGIASYIIINYDSLQTSYDDTENRFILEVGRFRVSLQYNNNAQELVASFAATFGNIQLHLSMPICYNSINILLKIKYQNFAVNIPVTLLIAIIKYF